MTKSHWAVGHIAALITVCVWGTTFISTKVLLRAFSPLEILFFRFCVGYLFLWVVHPHFIRPAGMKRELLFAGAGFCGVTLYFLFENIALTYTLASNVGIIISTAPFFTAVAAHFLLKGEPLHSRFLIGFLLAIAGIALIAFNGSYILKLNPIGDVLAILASMVWAVYSVLMRKISSWGYHGVAYTRRVFFYGLIFMLPVLPFAEFRLPGERLADPVNLLNLLFLGLGASAICFVIWNWCVKSLGAVRTSAYIYLSPIVTMVAASLILHEPITIAAVAGAILTLAGLVFSEKHAKKENAVTEQTE